MAINLTKIGTSLSRDHISALPPVPLNSLYLHVPFCTTKCHYCDFYSIPGENRELMQQYVDALRREIDWWQGHFQRTGARLQTLFFGGGTPTLLPLDLMRQTLTAIRSSFPVDPEAEWTVEANPATIDAEYCAMLLENGVNRLSLGAQSLNEAELKTLGRIHDASQVIETVETAARVGFKRLSIDLMYAIPGQTAASWQQTLERAIDLGNSHISCYCLTLEHGTPMYRKTNLGQIPAVPEEVQLSYMKATRQFLADRGLRAYEISNYATAGEACRHNLVYWQVGNYAGLGPGAASHLEGLRWRNAPDVRKYIRGVLEKGAAPLVDVETLTASQRAAELLMMSLRLTEGLSWERFERVTGQNGEQILAAAVERLARLGLLRPTSCGIQLTEAGVFVADEVIGELVREAD